MSDNILYEVTSGQQHDGSISMQPESVIIPVGYKTISSTLLRPMQHLGQGAFGQVYLASLFVCDSEDQVLVVVSLEFVNFKYISICDILFCFR